MQPSTFLPKEDNRSAFEGWICKVIEVRCMWHDVAGNLTAGFMNHNPRCSMYGIFTYICPKNDPNVGKYSIHRAFGNLIILGVSDLLIHFLMKRWDVWDFLVSSRNSKPLRVTVGIFSDAIWRFRGGIHDHSRDFLILDWQAMPSCATWPHRKPNPKHDKPRALDFTAAVLRSDTGYQDPKDLSQTREQHYPWAKSASFFFLGGVGLCI